MRHKHERDIVVYRLAKEYLLSFEPVTKEMLRKHVDSADNPKGINSFADVYQQLVRSAQNASMKSTVIGGALGGIERLGQVLCDFDPVKTKAKYGDNSEQLLKDIVSVLKPAGQIRRTPKSIWPQFCKSVLSAAEFLLQFSSVNDFISWVDHFDKDDRARPALPMLLANEVYGIGFPLACDSLKELGYLDFCKPDVHLKNILPALQLSKSNNDYAIFKAIVRIARSNDTKPYTVDKIFWLIGSGNFYDSEITIGKHGNDFVDFVKNRTGD